MCNCKKQKTATRGIIKTANKTGSRTLVKDGKKYVIKPKR